MYYQNLFNQEYINKQYCELLKQKEQREQREQQEKFDREQKLEISKMIKALEDFFEASQKIAPQYESLALSSCIFEISKRLSKK